VAREGRIGVETDWDWDLDYADVSRLRGVSSEQKCIGAVVEGSSPLAKQIARIAGDMVTTRPGAKKPNPVRRLWIISQSARRGEPKWNLEGGESGKTT
jgi:hypothetical protein